MARLASIPRPFLWPMLILAGLLVAVASQVAYDRYAEGARPDDGWQTYRNERFDYEIRYPGNWVITEANIPGPTGAPPQHYVSLSERSLAGPGSNAPAATDRGQASPPLVLVWVNTHSDQCAVPRSPCQGRVVSVRGVQGLEVIRVLRIDSPGCEPQPGCRQLPVGILRRFERGGTRYQVSADMGLFMNENVRADFEVGRKIVQSFRFVD